MAAAAHAVLLKEYKALSKEQWVNIEVCHPEERLADTNDAYS